MWTSHLSGIGSLYFSRLDQWSEQKVTRDWDRNSREIGGGFSSSSNRIFYSSTVRGAYEIWHVPSIGGVGLRTTSTHNPVRDVFPACSPVDERVAFYSNRSGNWDIWLLETDGTPRQLTQSSSNEIYPVWSHNGKSISFTTDRDGNNDIWIMDSDGNQARPLVTGPAKEGWSAWSHDGRYLYFVSDRGGTSNIWMQDARGEHVRQVTPFRSLDLGLPEATLFTKFVVTGSELILPLETRTGNIYVLSLSKDLEGT
jgi:Tol biopolymer transport system component